MHGDVALHQACRAGHQDCVALLLNHHANVNLSNAFAQTALHDSAALPERTKIMSMLIEAGACINQVDKFGDTPLHKACRAGQVENVQLLLKCRADFKLKNHSGFDCYEIVARQISFIHSTIQSLLAARQLEPSQHVLEDKILDLNNSLAPYLSIAKVLEQLLYPSYLKILDLRARITGCSARRKT